MKFKIGDFPDPMPSNPFEHDKLGREEQAKAIATFIENVDGPFVLAINSPWGMGKTAFVKMLKAYLEHQQYSCVYYSAWETDYSVDPLVSFLGEIQQQVIKDPKSEQAEVFEKAKQAAGKIAKNVPGLLLKILVRKGLGLKDEDVEGAVADFAQSTADNLVDAYSDEKQTVQDFKEELTNTVQSLGGGDQKPKLIVFVDELDRCRPDFAISLLERMKHFFDVENIIFVLSTDKQQLGVSLSALYGEGLNHNEYLRRFIDLEIELERPDPEKFATYLANSLELKNYRDFDPRDFNSLTRVFFKDLSLILGLSLRQQIAVFTLVRTAMLATPTNYSLGAPLMIIMAVMKIVNREMYEQYKLPDGKAKPFVDLIRKTEKGDAYANESYGQRLEALLIAGKNKRRAFGDNSASSEYMKYRWEVENANTDEVAQPSRSRDVFNQIQSILSEWNNSINCDYIAKKLDLVKIQPPTK